MKSLPCLLLLLALLAVPRLGLAQGPPPRTLHVGTRPNAVTVYRGRASVTRTAKWSLAPGLYELYFESLPESLQQDTIQARVSGPARVLAVDYLEQPAEVAASSQLAALDAEIAAQDQALTVVEEQLELIERQNEFLDALTVRSASDAQDRAGSADLDLEAIRSQMIFIEAERAALFEKRRGVRKEHAETTRALELLHEERSSLGGEERVHRTAVATVSVLKTAEVTVDLVYLVDNASWEPAYNVRVAADGSIVSIEYDAILTQHTGEDWSDVDLTLSTAQPAIAANPPTLKAWYVDIRGDGRPWPSGAMTEARDTSGGIESENEAERLRAIAADAAIGGAGPSVTYALPRVTTVKTNVAARQRTRIANVDIDCRFVHVAMPYLSDAVYVRGALTNRSNYHLLPGRASIFVGQDFVGPTRLGSVPPASVFEIYFGIDRSVVARRELVEKKTAKTGLLGGGRKTTYDWRITIDNASGKTIQLELWDRIPVSRTDQIVVDFVKPSHALVTDADYVEDDRPRGLLKWMLAIPAESRGAAPFVVSYGLRISRAKDVQMTPLPD